MRSKPMDSSQGTRAMGCDSGAGMRMEAAPRASASGERSRMFIPVQAIFLRSARNDLQCAVRERALQRKGVASAVIHHSPA